MTTGTADDAARWLLRLGACAAPQARVLGFPHAGGSASAFHGWGSALPAHVDLWAVRLPGREGRIAEPPLRRMDEIAAHVASAVAPLLEPSCVFFGHSMGAILAFEVARALRRRNGPMPAQLLLACSPAPHLCAGGRQIHALPDPEFLDELRRMDGTPEAVFKSPELLALLMDTLRADFEACETYTFVEEPPLEVPIAVFAGLADRSVANADVEAWRQHTAARFTMRTLPGGHFLPLQVGDLFRLAIWRELAPLLGAAPSASAAPDG